MWIPSGSRISPRPPELALLPELLRRRALSAGNRAGSSCGVRWTGPRSSSGAPSPRSSWPVGFCASVGWSWPAGAAGEGRCISVRVTTSGWTRGSRETMSSGTTTSAEQPSGSAPGGAPRSRSSARAVSRCTRGARSPASWASSSASLAAARGRSCTRAARLSAFRSGAVAKGALFSSCAYRRWDPAALIQLLDVDDTERASLVSELGAAGVGVGELEAALDDLDRVGLTLVASFDRWPGGGAASS